MSETNAGTRVEISKKLVMINSASSLVALALNVTVLVWLQQFLLKRISTEEYSMLPVLYSIMMFAPLLTTTLTQGLGRYTTEAYAKGDTQRVTQIVSSMFPILLGVGCIVLLLGLLFASSMDVFLSFAPKYQGEAKLMLGLLMLSLVFQVILSPFCVGLEIRQKFVILNVVSTGGQLLRLTILFVLLFAVSVKVLWVIVATVSAALITQIVTILLSRQAVPCLKLRWSAINWQVASQLLSFGGWSTVSGIAITIGSSADAIILNRLATPLDVTCFYLGSLAFRFINLGDNVASRPLRPALVSMYANGQSERLRGIFLKGGRWSLWFTLFFVVPLMVYGRNIVSLYVGGEFQTGGIVMGLLLLLFPFRGGVRMLFQLADATANIRRLSLCLFSMSIFNLGLTLCFVGILNMGALGSGLGTAISTILFYPVLLWPLGLRLAGVDLKTWYRKTFRPGLLPGIAGGAVLLGLGIFISIDSWLKVFLCIFAGNVVYIAVLWWGALQNEDFNDLKKVHAVLSDLPGLGRLFKRFSLGGVKS